MAIVYVDSAATGANDGTTKADAYTSMVSAAAAALAGDSVWVNVTHQEPLAVSYVLNFVNGTSAAPITIVRVDFATDTYTPSTSSTDMFLEGVTNNDFILRGNVITYGLSFIVDDDAIIGNSSSNEIQRHIDGVFEIDDAVTIQLNDNYIRSFENCHFITGSTGFEMPVSGGDFSEVRFINCRWSGAEVTNFGSALGAKHIYFDNCDLSIFTNLFPSVTQAHLRFHKCIFKSGWTVGNTTVNRTSRIVVEECSSDDPITTPPLSLNLIKTHYGTITPTLSVFRDEGTTDGFQANPWSVELSTNTNVTEGYIGIEHDLAQIVVEAGAAISGATPRGVFHTTERDDPLAAATAYSADGSSNWNGSGVSVPQQASVALSNGQTLTIHFASDVTLTNTEFVVQVKEPDQVGGKVEIKVLLYRPSTQVYVCPTPTLA